MKCLILITLIACVLCFTSLASGIRLKRGLSDDAEKLIKDSQHISIGNVGQLIELVDRHQATECLARVICELTNNPHFHGDSGSRFAKALLNFRQSKHPMVKYYLDAMSTGVRSKVVTQCKTAYPECNHSTGEIINVGNRVLRA